MLAVWLALVAVVGGGMLWAALKTQVKEGDKWRERAQRREYEKRTEPARRGTIFSSDGKVLATTMPVCDLVLDLGRYPVKGTDGKPLLNADGEKKMVGMVEDDSAFRANLPEVCRLLHEAFPAREAAAFRRRIMEEYVKPSPGHCLYVARRVPYAEWDRIRKMKGWERCVCTRTAEGSVMGYVRAHTYGNLGENMIGLRYTMEGVSRYTGLEGYYDSVLRGCDGHYLCRRLTRGVWLPVEGARLEDSVLQQRRVDGASIVATMDTRFQDIAESALRESMQKNGGERGCAILMEVGTGYVLACSSLTRDTAGKVEERLWNDVACSDIYEPGSTFKTVVMTAMLGDRRIGLDTSFRVRAGGEKSYGTKDNVISDGHGLATDTLSLPGVLARSSNVGMCELGWTYYRHRRADLRQRMEEVFPFGKLRPDLAVTEGRLWVNDLSSDRDFLNLCYGYSCVTSPLRLVTFYNALAGGGRMVKPLFCREILSGGRPQALGPVVLREHICSEETAKQMREMLTGVVEHGTGDNIRTAVYGIAGKTGTAEVGRDRSRNNSSFVGFFPADAPRYTCLVLVEGASVAARAAAAPVFRKIADCVVAFDKELGSIRLTDSVRAVQPVVARAPRRTMERVCKVLGVPFAAAEESFETDWVAWDSEKGCYAGYEPPAGEVPDCRGMTVRDAMALLRCCGLRVRFAGMGKVASQSPQPHSAAKQGEVVYLGLKN